MEHYFTKIYSTQLQAGKKSIPPKNIIVYQVVQSSCMFPGFLYFYRKKLENSSNHQLMDQYNQYLTRCDLIDLWEECRLPSAAKILILTLDQVKDELDQLFLERLLDLSSTPPSDESKQTIRK